MDNKFQKQSDEELIEMLRKGNENVIDYLLDKYKNMVKKKARMLFIIGGDTDDLIQEGMIGLYKAIRDYNSEKEASFLSFAHLCVSRQMYTAINASNRKKHSPLNTSLSFSNTQEDSGYINEKDNPEQVLLNRERMEDIDRIIHEKLSVYEKIVMELYMEGDNYVEIAKKTGKPPKSVDNALQRIKGKIKEFM